MARFLLPFYFFVSMMLTVVPCRDSLLGNQFTQVATMDQFEQLEEKVKLYEENSSDKYQRLASELDRDLSWIAIVVALFSLFSGVVIPFIINSNYKKQFEKDIKENEKAYEEKVQELDNKLKSFSEEYSAFKQNLKISSLLERANDSDDPAVKLELYTKILDINSKHQTALLRRGIIYRQNDAFPDAIADFKRFVSINPESAIGYSNLGFTYYKANDIPHAKEQYSKALSINPSYPACLYRMSLALFDEGAYFDALGYIDRAIKEKSDSIAYHRRRLKILMKINPKHTDIEAEREIISRLEDENKK